MAHKTKVLFGAKVIKDTLHFHQDSPLLIFLPPAMTEPLASYLRHEMEIAEFCSFVERLVSGTDSRPGRNAKEIVLFNAHQEFRKYLPLILELLITRATNNFLTYISELLTQIHRTRPETLRSSETIKFEDVLKHSTMDQLIYALVEKRVESLAYKGMEELNKDLNAKMGLSLFPDHDDLRRAIQIIELRNVITHNRGLVSQKYKRRTDTNQKLGSKVKLHYRSIFSDVSFLRKNALDIDREANRKFEMPNRITATDFEDRGHSPLRVVSELT
jgi:hypothetical protein